MVRVPPSHPCQDKTIGSAFSTKKTLGDKPSSPAPVPGDVRAPSSHRTNARALPCTRENNGATRHQCVCLR